MQLQVTCKRLSYSLLFDIFAQDMSKVSFTKIFKGDEGELEGRIETAYGLLATLQSKLVINNNQRCHVQVNSVALLRVFMLISHIENCTAKVRVEFRRLRTFIKMVT